MWRGLARWVRRRPDVPADAEPFSHHRLSAAPMWVFVGLSVVEVVALDLILHALLPWWPLRVVVAVLGVWGVVWMLGMLGATVTSPHLLTDATLRVRAGLLHDVEVALDDVASARRQERDLDSSMRTLQLDTEAGELLLGVSGRTNVALTLHSPTTLPTALGPARVHVVRLWADEPRDLVARLGSRPAPRAR